MKPHVFSAPSQFLVGQNSVPVATLVARPDCDQCRVPAQDVLRAFATSTRTSGQLSRPGSGGDFWFESRRRSGLLLTIVDGLVFRKWHVPDGAV